MGTHVHPQLIHVSVWQKPPQCCKVISLQYNKKINRIKMATNTKGQNKINRKMNEKQTNDVGDRRKDYTISILKRSKNAFLAAEKRIYV